LLRPSSRQTEEVFYRERKLSWFLLNANQEEQGDEMKADHRLSLEPLAEVGVLDFLDTELGSAIFLLCYESSTERTAIFRSDKESLCKEETRGGCFDLMFCDEWCFA
jgi:hypothetical protein